MFQNLKKRYSKSKKPFLTTEFLFSALNFSMKLFAIHPLPDNFDSISVLLYRILWWFYLINDLLLILPTINLLFRITREDIITLGYASKLFVGISESMTILIYFRLQERRIEVNISTNAK